jgi:glycosyltransferase involved in cell wall biosynthesis
MSDPSIPLITTIIPVYNESQGIRRVLEIVCQYAPIQEIIVVDDGSTDDSVQTVVQAQVWDNRVRLITHSENRGKGQAVYSGLQSTQADLILMLDADLRGLRVQHLEELVLPVVVDGLDMTIGIFRGGRFYSDFSHWATPWLSGQRCLWREHLEKICWKAAEGYGLETAITVASMRNHWRCKKVIWRGVSHPPSELHRGLLGGFLNRAKMYAQIGRAFYLASLEQ